MTASLANKTVMITGGARRVGAEVARRLHAQGANLAIHYRGSAQDAQALKSELERQRPRSVVLAQADLQNVSALAGVRDAALKAFDRIDVLINNASSFYPTPIGNATERDWEQLIGSNLKGPFFLSQLCAPHLRAAQGCIVNMVDIYGERPLKTYPIYSIAKAGLVMLTKSLARELAPEVRVNAIAPGSILWPENDGGAEVLSDQVKDKILSRTPLGRAGGPADIARTMLFLIQDAPYITGQILAVDAGRSIVL